MRDTRIAAQQAIYRPESARVPVGQDLAFEHHYPNKVNVTYRSDSAAPDALFWRIPALDHGSTAHIAPDSTSSTQARSGPPIGKLTQLKSVVAETFNASKGSLVRALPNARWLAIGTNPYVLLRMAASVLITQKMASQNAGMMGRSHAEAEHLFAPFAPRAQTELPGFPAKTKQAPPLPGYLESLPDDALDAQSRGYSILNMDPKDGFSVYPDETDRLIVSALEGKPHITPSIEDDLLLAEKLPSQIIYDDEWAAKKHAKLDRRIVEILSNDEPLGDRIKQFKMLDRHYRRPSSRVNLPGSLKMDPRVGRAQTLPPHLRYFASDAHLKLHKIIAVVLAHRDDGLGKLEKAYGSTVYDEKLLEQPQMAQVKKTVTALDNKKYGHEVIQLANKLNVGELEGQDLLSILERIQSDPHFFN